MSYVGARTGEVARPLDMTWSSPLVPGGVLLLVVCALVPIDAAFHEDQTFGDVAPFFAVGAIALLIVAATCCVLRSRIAALPAAPWVASALVVVAVRLGLRHLGPAIGEHGHFEESASTACLVVGVGLILRGVRTSDSDVVARPSRVAAIATVAIVLGTTLLEVVHVALPPMREGDSIHVVGAAVPLVVWAGLAVVCMWRAVGRADGSLFAAVALFATARALHKAVVLVSHGLGHPPSESPLALALVGALVVAATSGYDLKSALLRQRDELLESKASVEAVLAQSRRSRERAEERSHEAHNALAAIEGAVRTLERHYDALSDETREALSQAAIAELARLQQLISVEPRAADVVAFDVAEAIGPRIMAARAAGLRVAVLVPSGLVAIGSASDIAAVVQNLLENVRRHASGSEAVVTARRHGDHIVVEIADRGRGVPEAERESMFERGTRGASSIDSPGSGLGLHIARSTARDQGGELRCLPRMGGGTILQLELVAASRPPA